MTTTNEESAETLAYQFSFMNQGLPDFPGRVNDAIPILVITEELVY